MSIEGKVLAILAKKDAPGSDISKELVEDEDRIKAVLERLKEEGFLVGVW